MPKRHGSINIYSLTYNPINLAKSKLYNIGLHITHSQRTLGDLIGLYACDIFRNMREYALNSQTLEMSSHQNRLRDTLDHIRMYVRSPFKNK